MRTQLTVLAAAVALLCVACSQATSPAPGGPASTSRPPDASPSPAAAGSPSGSPSPTASPSASASAPSSPEPSPTTPGPASEPPVAPQRLQLRKGQTARLAHFDVTLVDQAFGKDGISIGWKVRVCYTHRHAAQNADDTTRVSTNPWSVAVRDGEGGGAPQWVALDRFPRDHGWVPEYATKNLHLGDCNLGWIGVRHDNPDLQWTALRYAPADFGDVVTWQLG